MALWITGQNLSVTASVGFIALFGIALQNGMVLVQYPTRSSGTGCPWPRPASRAAFLVLPALYPAAADETKRTPYIFLTVNGDYVAANFTGK